MHRVADIALAVAAGLYRLLGGHARAAAPARPPGAAPHDEAAAGHDPAALADEGDPASPGSPYRPAIARLEARLAEIPSARAFAEAPAALCAAFEVPAAALWLAIDEGSAWEHGLRSPARAGTPLAALFAPWDAALAAGETACIPDPAAEPDLCGAVRLEAGGVSLVPLPGEPPSAGALAIGWGRPLAVGYHEVAAARAAAGSVARAAERAVVTKPLRLEDLADAPARSFGTGSGTRAA